MSNLFPRPRVPDVPEPVATPDIEDEDIQRARGREIARQRARRGRESTILTEQPGGRGREFSRTLLG